MNPYPYLECSQCRNLGRPTYKGCASCNRGSNYMPVETQLQSVVGMYHTPTLIPPIRRVIFHDLATIVFWADGTKTVVKAYREPFDPEKGLAMAIAKKVLGTGYYPEIKKWTKGYEEEAAKQALRNFEKSMRRVPEVMANQGDDE